MRGSNTGKPWRKKGVTQKSGVNSAKQQTLLEALQHPNVKYLDCQDSLVQLMHGTLGDAVGMKMWREPVELLKKAVAKGAERSCDSFLRGLDFITDVQMDTLIQLQQSLPSNVFVAQVDLNDEFLVVE